MRIAEDPCQILNYANCRLEQTQMTWLLQLPQFLAAGRSYRDLRSPSFDPGLALIDLNRGSPGSMKDKLLISSVLQFQETSSNLWEKWQLRVWVNSLIADWKIKMTLTLIFGFPEFLSLDYPDVSKLWLTSIQFCQGFYGSSDYMMSESRRGMSLRRRSTANYQDSLAYLGVWAVVGLLRSLSIIL